MEQAIRLAPIELLQAEAVSAYGAVCALVGTDALKFLDKAATLHDLDGSFVIRKADAGDLGDPQLRQGHRQKSLDRFGGVAPLGEIGADVVTHFQ